MHTKRSRSRVEVNWLTTWWHLSCNALLAVDSHVTRVARSIFSVFTPSDYKGAPYVCLRKGGDDNGIRLSAHEGAFDSSCPCCLTDVLFISRTGRGGGRGLQQNLINQCSAWMRPELIVVEVCPWVALLKGYKACRCTLKFRSITHP